MVFEKYWGEEVLQAFLKEGSIILGLLRINQKNYEEAFVPHPDGVADVFVGGMKLRNRALNGDLVYVDVFPKTKWKIHIDALNEKANVIEEKLDEILYEMDQKICSSEQKNDLSHQTTASDSNACTQESSNSNSTKNNFRSKAKKSIQTNVAKLDDSSLNENQSAKPIQNKFTTLEELQMNNASQNVCASIRDRLKNIYLMSKRGSLACGESVFDAISPLVQPIRTGKVVGVLERKNNGCCAGTLKMMSDKNNKMARFSPRDSRMPRMNISSKFCPKGFFDRPDDFKNVLFVARIKMWDEKSVLPIGSLEKTVGEVGLIEPETEAILMEFDVDASEFAEDVLACLPIDSPWKIPYEEINSRRDFRENVVFTIDPESAKDLDDALSCESLGDGLYQVGVHIADVSHFVKPDTALNLVASLRSTSVYLVHKVVPMLPNVLCERLCSLNPGEDKLTFSVVWRMNEDGEIMDEWFGKTIIRSCAKLSYNHAQGFIDQPSRTWMPNELPPISNNVPIPVIVEKVLKLYALSRKLNNKRMVGGTLKLDQVKLKFILDNDSCLPLGWSVYEYLGSHSLIEEFMLLANMAVAHRIYKSHPRTALLRRHPPPQMKMLDEFMAVCESLGISIDGSSAGSLQRSLFELSEEGSEEAINKVQIVISLASKCMQQAQYFCIGTIEDQEQWRHYALNVPLYTHFTSPIRRYPDIVVHRQLAKALGHPDYQSSISEDVNSLDKQCDHSNDKKSNAKYAGDRSIELFLSLFIRKCGLFEEDGLVCGILNHSFDVFISKIGVVKRVYCEKMPLVDFIFGKENRQTSLTITWAPSEAVRQPFTQKIEIFTKVRCRIIPSSDPLKWNLEMKHPLDQK